MSINIDILLRRQLLVFLKKSSNFVFQKVDQIMKRASRVALKNNCV